MCQNIITLTLSVPHGRPLGLMKDDKSRGLRPGAVVPLHRGGQESSETFHTRCKLIPRPHVASTHAGNNCANPWGHYHLTNEQVYHGCINQFSTIPISHCSKFQKKKNSLVKC